MASSARSRTTGASVSKEDNNALIKCCLTIAQGSCQGLESIYLRNSLYHLFQIISLLTCHQDLRNHGDSPHDGRHDYTAMAEDVEAFIADQRLTQPTLIGHSMLVAVIASTHGVLLISRFS